MTFENIVFCLIDLCILILTFSPLLSRRGQASLQTCHSSPASAHTRSLSLSYLSRQKGRQSWGKNKKNPEWFTEFYSWLTVTTSHETWRPRGRVPHPRPAHRSQLRYKMSSQALCSGSVSPHSPPLRCWFCPDNWQVQSLWTMRGCRSTNLYQKDPITKRCIYYMKAYVRYCQAQSKILSFFSFLMLKQEHSFGSYHISDDSRR